MLIEESQSFDRRSVIRVCTDSWKFGNHTWESAHPRVLIPICTGLNVNPVSTCVSQHCEPVHNVNTVTSQTEPNQKEFIKLASVHNIEQWNEMTMAEEGNNNPMRPFTASCTAGDHVCVFNFCNCDEHHDWHEELRDMADSISFFNQHVSHLEPQLSACQNIWLPMVCAFAQKWGADRVPKDVKRSREEVEAGLQAAN